jgi:hypothetical protein
VRARDLPARGQKRPGLLNKNGLPLDEAALRAWQAGYLPGRERPDINALLIALDEDLKDRRKVYRERDADLVEAHRQAVFNNMEIDRLADEHGIEVQGKTRAQFYDEVWDRLSQNERAAEIAHHDAEAERLYAEAEARMRAEGGEPPQETGPPRTLEELEDELRQEETVGIAGQGAGGAGRSEPVGRDAGGLQAGDGSRGGGAGPGQRGAAPERPPNPALHAALDHALAEHRARLAAPRDQLAEEAAAWDVRPAMDRINDETAELEAELRAAAAAGQLPETELEGVNEAAQQGAQLARAYETAAMCMGRRS